MLPSELWQGSAVVCGIVTLCLCLLADMARTSLETTAFHAGCGAMLSLILVFCFTIAFGIAEHPTTYRIWQPFFGGLHFVILQFVGWLFYGVSLMVLCVLCYSFELVAQHRFGDFTFVGCLSFAATMILLASVPMYQPGINVWPGHIYVIKRDNAVALLIMLGALAQAIILDMFAFSLRSYRRALCVFLVLECFAATIVVVCQGIMRYNGHVLHPFRGGFAHSVLKCLGIFAISLATILLYTLFGGAAQDVPGLVFAVVFLYCFGLFLQILSLEWFDVQNNNQSVMRHLQLPLESIIFSLAAILCFSLSMIADNFAERNGVLSVIGSALLFSCAPTCHCLTAVLQSKSGYKAWQPFDGGPRFVVLQGIGWATYSVSLLLTILMRVNDTEFGLEALSFFSCLSAVILAVSPVVFDGTNHSVSVVSPRRIPRRRLFHFNGESVTGSMLAIGGVLMGWLADFEQRATIFPRKHIAFVALILLLIATPLAHLSGRRVHASYSFFQPFKGGADFIALQAFGWTLWSTMLPLYSVLALNLHFASETILPGVIFSCSLFGIAPAILLCLSIPMFHEGPVRRTKRSVIEEADRLLRQAETEEVRDALRQVITSLESVQSSPDPELVLPHFNTTITLFGVALSIFSLVFYGACELVTQFVVDSNQMYFVAPLCTVAALASILACIVTHCIDGRQRYPVDFQLWQPFHGGYNFVILQTIGWAFFALHFICSITTLFSWHMKHTTLLGVFILNGFFGLAAHILLLVSLSYYIPGMQEYESIPAASFLNRNKEWAVGGLLVISSVLIFVVDDLIRRRVSVLGTAPVIWLTALSCGASVPLSAVSFFRHRQHEAIPRGDRPYQLGLVSEILVLAAISQYFLFSAAAFVSYRWLFYLVFTATIGHIALLLMLVWQEQRDISFLFAELQAEIVTYFVYSFHFLCAIAWIYIAFFPMPTTVSVIFFVLLNALAIDSKLTVAVVQVFSGFLLLHGLVRRDWQAVCLMLPLLLYSRTYAGQIHRISRNRVTPWLVHKVQYLSDSVARYFSFRIKLTGDSFQPTIVGERYMFGFHPHGVCPYTCMWGTLCQQWKESSLPQVTVHVSGLLLCVPVIRDVLMSIGILDVSAEALEQTIQSGGSPLMVPGGQAEMRESSCGGQEMVLVARHKGFFRVALQHGCSVVPMISFGENDILSTLLFPSLQHWLSKNVGITYPQLPHGRFFLPFPHRTPITLAVGAPIPCTATTDPTPAQIDALHQQYYQQLSDLFEAKKASCGYPYLSLVLLE